MASHRDLTADILRERGFGLDQAGFEAAMAEQRARAQNKRRSLVKTTMRV